MNDLKFLDKKTFSRMVEEKVAKAKTSFSDAILILCTENGIDPLDMKKYISKTVKEKFEREANQLNLLKGKKINTLDV